MRRAATNLSPFLQVSCPESHAPDSQQVNTNNQDLVCQQELPLDHNPWAEDCIDAVVAHPAVPDVEQRLRWAVRNRKRLVKVIIVGGLSLIVLPGIMLGILMKDTRAGIALSTAIIGLIKLLADLYNYLNTRD